MSNNPIVYKAIIKQYLRSILDSLCLVTMAGAICFPALPPIGASFALRLLSCSRILPLLMSSVLFLPGNSVYKLHFIPREGISPYLSLQAFWISVRADVSFGPHNVQRCSIPKRAFPSHRK